MILYLDSSAIVKLFVAEEHSDTVRTAVRESEAIATHVLAYVEVSAAFARLSRTRSDVRLFRVLRDSLDVQWPTWDIVEAAEPLIRRSADLAALHGLRAYDSVHLAAVDWIFQTVGNTLQFAVYDIALATAAERMGIPLLSA